MNGLFIVMTSCLSKIANSTQFKLNANVKDALVVFPTTQNFHSHSNTPRTGHRLWFRPSLGFSWPYYWNLKVCDNLSFLRRQLVFIRFIIWQHICMFTHRYTRIRERLLSGVLLMIACQAVFVTVPEFLAVLPPTSLLQVSWKLRMTASEVR